MYKPVNHCFCACGSMDNYNFLHDNFKVVVQFISTNHHFLYKMSRKLGSMSAGTGVRGTGIREFGKFKNMGIRVRGDSANIAILKT